MLLIGFSIIGSQSRGAFLGGVIMAGFLVMKSRQRLLLSMLVVGFLAVGAFFVPQTWIDRMKTIETYQEDSSALSRLEVRRFGLKIATERPLGGGGFRAPYAGALLPKSLPAPRKGR